MEIKSEVWSIIHCLGLGQETMVCAACFSIFLRLHAIAIQHDDVIKWKHFPRYWPFVRGIHRSPVNYLHKGQWRGALMFSLICTWITGWVNNAGACDFRRHRAHYYVTVITRYALVAIIDRNRSITSELLSQCAVIRCLVFQTEKKSYVYLYLPPMQYNAY